MNKNKAAQQLGSLAGKKRLENGGVSAFQEMGKKSWENKQSPKRVAMQMIRAATASIAAYRRTEIKRFGLVCSSCEKILKKDGKVYFHHHDYNQPFILEDVCSDCHKSWNKKHKTRMLTRQTAQEIVDEIARLKGSQDRAYLIIARALDCGNWGFAGNFYGRTCKASVS